MPQAFQWDIFCRVIDNHGDLGVCWRLSAELGQRGQRVRLWVDDASALSWMAPHGAHGVELRPWPSGGLAPAEPATEVLVEAFGCEIPAPFLAATVKATPMAAGQPQPVWLNLEYLSAEPWVERHHGLPSPVLSGPAAGWTKHFFYPGFTPGTGGLLRERDLPARQQAFDRAAWRHARAPKLAPSGRLWSLFCYEPEALPPWLDKLATGPDQVLVAPGRPLAAVHQALAAGHRAPVWHALPYVDQAGFDEMLQGCDINAVRGEDSLVRALWAGRPLVWQLYPQEDQAHHAKVQAFLEWLQAPQSLRRFHRVWNAMEPGPLPELQPATLANWQACVQAARQRLLAQPDLVTQLMHWVTEPGRGGPQTV